MPCLYDRHEVDYFLTENQAHAQQTCLQAVDVQATYNKVAARQYKCHNYIATYVESGVNFNSKLNYLSKSAIKRPKRISTSNTT